MLFGESAALLKIWFTAADGKALRKGCRQSLTFTGEQKEEGGGGGDTMHQASSKKNCSSNEHSRLRSNFYDKNLSEKRK